MSSIVYTIMTIMYIWAIFLWLVIYWVFTIFVFFTPKFGKSGPLKITKHVTHCSVHVPPEQNLQICNKVGVSDTE